jgi:hypothetical protein
MGLVSAMTNCTDLKSKFFESLALALEIFHGVFVIHVMRLEEAIQFDAFQAEHLAQLDFGDAGCFVFFESEGFEGAAFKLRCERSSP